MFVRCLYLQELSIIDPGSVYILEGFRITLGRKVTIRSDHFCISIAAAIFARLSFDLLYFYYISRCVPSLKVNKLVKNETLEICEMGLNTRRLV